MWLNLDLLPCTVTGSWIDVDFRLTGFRVPGYNITNIINAMSIINCHIVSILWLTLTICHSQKGTKFVFYEHIINDNNDITEQLRHRSGDWLVHNVISRSMWMRRGYLNWDHED